MTKLLNCNGCTACCEGDTIVLHPECGDVIADYQAERSVNPITFKPAWILKKEADGSCVYLEKGKGCTIHGRAPAICREFSCADQYAKLGAAMCKRLVDAGRFNAETVRMGRMKLKEMTR